MTAFAFDPALDTVPDPAEDAIGVLRREVTVLREHNERWLNRIAELEEAFRKMRAIYVENNETEALDKMVDIIEKVLRHG